MSFVLKMTSLMAVVVVLLVNQRAEAGSVEGAAVPAAEPDANRQPRDYFFRSLKSVREPRDYFFRSMRGAEKNIDRDHFFRSMRDANLDRDHYFRSLRNPTFSEEASQGSELEHDHLVQCLRKLMSTQNRQY